MSQPYSEPWSSRRPGCLIVLLDQSGSMDETFGGAQIGAGKKKSDMAATVLNSVLNEFVSTNTLGAEIKNRADVAVIGYEDTTARSILGGPLASHDFVNLTELNDNPLDIETRMKKEMDDTGQIVEVPVYVPIWVKPVSGKGTPMVNALTKAQTLAENWADQHPASYPPIIVNITDGESTDGDITGAAQALTHVQTNVGTALLYNVHITSHNANKIEYPSSETQLPNDKYARILFNVSSLIPESALSGLQQGGYPANPGARGFIFNGDAASIRQMFIFASIQATLPSSPNADR